MRHREQWYEKYKDYPAVPSRNVEQSACHAPLAKEAIKGFIGRSDIEVVSRLYRERDTDGTSFKFCLDSIVDAKILRSDTPKDIREIRYRQEKANRNEKEETIITIMEV